ncbi:MAG: putative 2-aminoethylphosphonate ABC transporter ATP-binding protein [Alphaproteobacteria bacterium]
MAEGDGARPYLRIEGVSKSFGSFVALRDISLAVEEGEFVCFLGPSGCGKTTLLRAIAGLDPQTTGTIIQDGRDVSALPPSARDFGIVFQSYALFPNLTVAANVAYGLENRRTPRAEVRRRVEELLDLVGLGDQGRKYPAQLSGGQQQRVALARALALSPGLLLLDEPLSALDARVRVHLRHEVRELQRRLGVTTIMVTHDQEEALTMADRIVVMNQGVIDQVGTPREIYAQPANRFVADFVGTMNFLAGTLTERGRVRVGRLELACPEAADGLGQGAAVTVCLRPEDVAVRGVDAATPNAAKARVASAEFLGPFLRAYLAVEGVDEVELTADFSVNAVRDLRIGEATELLVALPPDRLRVFAAG